jgi:hypothetical protein
MCLVVHIPARQRVRGADIGYQAWLILVSNGITFEARARHRGEVEERSEFASGTGSAPGMTELFKEIANGKVGRTIRCVHYAERIEGVRPEEGIRRDGLDNAAGSSTDEAEIV